jgi:hypothetical protein
MEEHQLTKDEWRGTGDEPDGDIAGISDAEAIDKVLAERRRAEYLRLHDDDEAELELPR